MGRIKGFLCSFCLDAGQDQQQNDHSFDRGIDVSHLATPHISSAQSTQNSRPSPNINKREEPTNNNDQEDNNYSHYHSHQDRIPTPHQSISAISTSLQNPLDLNAQPASSGHATPNRDNNPVNGSPSFAHHNQEQNHRQRTPSPRDASPVNHYELQNSRSNSPEEQNRSFHHPLHQQQQHQQMYQLNDELNQDHQQQMNNLPEPSTSNGLTTKLSYDIISVREPLAKILSERQLLLQAQQQQRLLLGDHDYIEVYGERGSSCFYEEIAGSVTSSATYDQIGVGSNHNYQVLINAYASNRPNIQNNDENNPSSSSNSNNESQEPNRSQENMYDVTNPPDQVDGNHGEPSTSISPERLNANQNLLEEQQHDNRVMQASQSIPVYSVINKATRRSNPIRRIGLENDLPPRPPPKNLFLNQHSLSAIHTYNEPSNTQPANGNSPSSSSTRPWSPAAQLPSTSSYNHNHSNNADKDKTNTNLTNNHHRGARLPQPPPRFSKHPAFNATDRPLPHPDEKFNNDNNIASSSNNATSTKTNSNSANIAIANTSKENNNNNDRNTTNRNSSRDDESSNNGYELLRSNLDDDLLDVGYEKIRESNRYSGENVSSQLYQMHLDNGGYESVQPIYSSPSGVLAEPNYEAIAESDLANRGKN